MRVAMPPAVSSVRRGGDVTTGANMMRVFGVWVVVSMWSTRSSARRGVPSEAVVLASAPVAREEELDKPLTAGAPSSGLRPMRKVHPLGGWFPSTLRCVALKTLARKAAASSESSAAMSAVTSLERPFWMLPGVRDGDIVTGT